MKRREFLRRTGKLAAAIWASARVLPVLASDSQPGAGRLPDRNGLTIHPENAKYFLFRGQPLVLVGASEHYGSIVNRRFDFERYLREAADEKQTVTRTFLLFREQQSARNPYSPLKPESPDFVTPWPRTGPGVAADGELKYDLEQWNPEYFERLHRFLALASKLGIVVELTVFSNTYAGGVWDLNPLRARNNLQGVGDVKWQEYTSLRNKELVDRQKAYARKIVQETAGYDNIYYEICNEPGGGFADLPTLGDVDAWQSVMAKVIRDEMRRLGHAHLVAGQNAFSYTPKFSQDFDASFLGAMLDVVNVHPLPGLRLKGREYQLGNFMSKELQLEQFRDFFLAAYREAKPVISDEDNAASMYVDDIGWTIHRKRSWMALMCGAHYDYIDFSIQAHLEAGTEESRKGIRRWMRNLSEFIHSFDVIRAKPNSAWVAFPPKDLVCAGLAVEGKDYVAYLADGREVTDAQAGKLISGQITVRLPAGQYQIRMYSPVRGEYFSPRSALGGEPIIVELPPFTHDVVIRATRLS